MRIVHQFNRGQHFPTGMLKETKSCHFRTGNAIRWQGTLAPWDPVAKVPLVTVVTFFSNSEEQSSQCNCNLIRIWRRISLSPSWCLPSPGSWLDYHFRAFDCRHNFRREIISYKPFKKRNIFRKEDSFLRLPTSSTTAQRFTLVT